MGSLLKGKNILITGGSSGIGKSTAFRCAQEGANVVVADTNQEEGQNCIKEISEAGFNANFITTDVTQGSDILNAIDYTTQKYGQLDGAFNNAGVEGVFSNITKIMHPSAISSVKLNGEKIVSSQIEAVFSFVAIYISFFLLFMFVLIFQNVDFYSAFSGTAAAINNLGPGLGDFSENYSTLSDVGKFTLTMAMIVGRLELFGVLILFVPSFWRS